MAQKDKIKKHYKRCYENLISNEKNELMSNFDEEPAPEIVTFSSEFENFTKLPEKQVFTCEICAKEFDQQEASTRHKYQVHGSTQSRTCNVCQKLFSSRNALKEHFRRIHHSNSPDFLPFGENDENFYMPHQDNNENENDNENEAEKKVLQMYQST